ncbi:DNA-binding response regulator, LuxR family protein [Plesiocystis pacifica SIR-1]|uniref:DNA-binding response regulator, LuxR family protein n=1 Tax=Plesiocystis pacifica SIR-1 TaxID=391625 RepID=A6G4Y6_9BACT|nr:response regulator [Plesiocystis pacifica]EDM79078.1 DNA-binding response regulator, LuxR family protein [Plesiocystis pacifica SIR-1]
MAGEHILIVEDDPSVQTLLGKALTAQGYRVTQAQDGLAGLTALEEEQPDLIIADIMMPRLDGMTFVKAIKRNAGTRSVPVIFLTAKNDPRSVVEGINVGAKYYVTKPFQLDELLSKVEKAL